MCISIVLTKLSFTQDLATVDSILLRELPPVEDKDAVSNTHSPTPLKFLIISSYDIWPTELLLYYYQRLALKRLIDISMGVIVPLSEQLTKPLPNAVVLVTLKELSSGAHRLLPEGKMF